MKRTDILAFVVFCGILDEYRARDACLDELINLASELPEVWQTSLDIDVTSPSSLPASHFERIARRRLALIPDEPGVEQLRVATARFVDYCTAYPDAGIWDVMFNCPEHSYTVRGGQVNERLDIICVTVGKHIPEYALRQRWPKQRF